MIKYGCSCFFLNYSLICFFLPTTMQHVHFFILDLVMKHLCFKSECCRAFLKHIGSALLLEELLNLCLCLMILFISIFTRTNCNVTLGSKYPPFGTLCDVSKGGNDRVAGKTDTCSDVVRNKSWPLSQSFRSLLKNKFPLSGYISVLCSRSRIMCRKFKQNTPG